MRKVFFALQQKIVKSVSLLTGCDICLLGLLTCVTPLLRGSPRAPGPAADSESCCDVRCTPAADRREGWTDADDGLVGGL